MVCEPCPEDLQMLQPSYTMHGFNWFDRRGTEGVGFVRALRTLLTNNIPNILPRLRKEIAQNLERMHAEQPLVDGMHLLSSFAGSM